MAKVVVLGAGFAGVNFCLKMIGSEHDVELLDVRSSHDYVPGIIDVFNDRVEEDELRINLNELFKDTDIHFSREKVESINPSRNTIKTNAGNHEYTYLVVGLGSEPRTFGVDISEAYTPYSLESVKKIDRELEDAEKVTVVGSGYVGVEVAAEISEHADVTIIDGATRPMPKSSEKASHHVIDYLNDTNISFVGGKKVTKVEEDIVVTEDGSRFESDLTLWSGGIQAADIVQDSFDCGPEGIDVDPTLRSNAFPDVFVIGDCADAGLATAHNAIKQAKIAAHNIGKNKSEMKTYKDSTYPLLVSLGDTGLLVYGKRAFKNRSFRVSKDMVFKGYKASLKAHKVKARVF